MKYFSVIHVPSDNSQDSALSDPQSQSDDGGETVSGVRLCCDANYGVDLGGLHAHWNVLRPSVQVI